MLSTDSLVILALFVAIAALIVALASMLIARSARSYCAAWGRWAENNAEASVVAGLSAEMTDLRDGYASLLASHKKLRSRITMRVNREKKRLDNAGDVDLSSESDKKALRLAARQVGLLK